MSAARRQSGMSLIECLVYIAVFAVLLAIGTAAFFFCWDHWRAAIFATEDISSRPARGRTLARGRAGGDRENFRRDDRGGRTGAYSGTGKRNCLPLRRRRDAPRNFRIEQFPVAAAESKNFADAGIRARRGERLEMGTGQVSRRADRKSSCRCDSPLKPPLRHHENSTHKSGPKK